LSTCEKGHKEQKEEKKANQSPNLPYSKGMGSHAAAIRFMKVV
jgi:hypothetical protein